MIAHISIIIIIIIIILLHRLVSDQFSILADIQGSDIHFGIRNETKWYQYISILNYFCLMFRMFGISAPQINQKGATERKEHNTADFTDHDTVVVSELPWQRFYKKPVSRLTQRSRPYM